MNLSLLGKRVKEIRRQRGMTLEALSEQIGISRNFLWEIEAGRKAPALKTLCRLSTTLNISIDYLMGITEDNRHIDNSRTNEHDQLITQIVRKLHSFDNRGLNLILEIIDSIGKYADVT